MQIGFVRLDNATFHIPNANPDDVGIDQAPDLRLTLLEIAVETGVLQRDRRLCGQQVQDRDPTRGERVRGQRVLEVEQPRQPPLFDQRLAKDRLGLSAAQIVILGEEIGPGGIIENHAFVRSDDMAHEGFGTGDPVNLLLAQYDFDLIAGSLALCLNQIVTLCW